MVEYVGMSVRDIYSSKCEELGCRTNSLLLKELCKTPDLFDTATRLDLSKNFVGPKGLLPVLEVVKVSVGLKYLSLRDNQLTNQCVINLADVVQTHKSLTAIDLSDNPITIGAGKAILELVKTNSQIEEVSLESTAVKDMLLRAIEVQLNKNKSDAQRVVAANIDAAEVTMTSDISVGTVRTVLSSLPTTVHETLFDENPAPQLIKLCSEHQASFTDPQFPPDWKSIQKSGIKDYPVAKWVRVKDFANPRLFPETIDLAHIGMGHASVSWLAESVAALLREGDRVENLFTPKQISPTSVYSVKLFVDGKWRYVLVDDWVPVDAGNSPVFSRSVDDGSVWMMLLEKAVAKAHGSYLAIDESVTSTHPLEKAPCGSVGMVDLTGGVGISRNLHQDDFNSEEWWVEFTELSARGALLTCSTSSKNAETLSDVGLAAAFSYSIISIRAINGFRLLHIQSHFATSSWVGEWGDNSPLWQQYPDIKDALDFANKSDSSFWMPYVSFLQHFETVHIVKTFPSWSSTLVSGAWDYSSAGGPYFEQEWSKNPRYKISMQRSGKVFVHLMLPDKRYARSVIDTMAFHIVKADYFPVRYDKDNVTVKTPYLVTNAVSFEGELEQGMYWLVPSTYVAGVVGEFNIRILSESPFTIQKERLDKYWKEAVVKSKWVSSGEYQSGEDHPQFQLSIAPNPDPVRLLLTVEATPNDSNCLVVFICASKSPGTRMLSALSDDSILVKSKYLIGSSVQVECQLPGGENPYVIVPCLQPEGTRSKCVLSVLCSTPTFSLTELPLWSKKTVRGSWTHSSTYQDASGNPQFELICPIPGQQFVVKMEVFGHDDPSILFFVVDNHGKQCQGLSGLIPESAIVCTSTYIRGTSISKDFTLPNPSSDSYVIVPCLQPSGSAAEVQITVSCPSDDYQLHNILS